MTTLADKSLLSGGETTPMLEKTLVMILGRSMGNVLMLNRHSWKIDSFPLLKKGPISFGLNIVEGLTVTSKAAINIILQSLPTEIYALVSQHRVAKDLWEKIKLLMQGTSLMKQERECKLYDEFDKFTYKKGESLHEYYLSNVQPVQGRPIYLCVLEQREKLHPGASGSNKGNNGYHSITIAIAGGYVAKQVNQTSQTGSFTHNALYQADDLDTLTLIVDELNSAKKELLWRIFPGNGSGCTHLDGCETVMNVQKVYQNSRMKFLNRNDVVHICSSVTQHFYDMTPVTIQFRTRCLKPPPSNRPFVHLRYLTEEFVVSTMFDESLYPPTYPYVIYKAPDSQLLPIPEVVAPTQVVF
ncbi:hypothetical protein Tco_0695672 [Tanacetum coccineum]